MKGGKGQQRGKHSLIPSRWRALGKKNFQPSINGTNNGPLYGPSLPTPSLDRNFAPKYRRHHQHSLLDCNHANLAHKSTFLATALNHEAGKRPVAWAMAARHHHRQVPEISSGPCTSRIGSLASTTRGRNDGPRSRWATVTERRHQCGLIP